MHIHQQGAELWGGRIQANATVDLPTDRHVHVFVARGSGVLEPGGALTTGDAAGSPTPTGCRSRPVTTAPSCRSGPPPERLPE
ncbi:MAG: hypothetical protein R2697_03695 [Ilumatobacteraceae bacterium]